MPIKHPIDLDAMLTAEQAAPWLGLSKRELLAKSRGKRSAIPALRLSRKVLRFVPRVIIAKLAADAGVSIEVIKASLGAKEAA